MRTNKNQHQNPTNWLQVLLPSFLLLFATVYLGHFVGQSDAAQILFFYIFSFGLYFWINHKTANKKTIQWMIGLAILLRLSLVFGMPQLSDDIYRFIWDGRLIINGINPFDHLPSFYIENNLNISGINRSLYEQLNSPEYFTIYPPIDQGIFAFACWLFPSNLLGSAIVMKLFLFAFEIGSIFLIVKLLKHFKKPAKLILLYALNPLIIQEVCGNLHFEGAMVFFLLLSLWFLVKREHSKSAIAMAFSIASKLLPLMFLPLFIRRLGWRKSFSYFSIIAFILFLLFAPLINGVFVSNFGDSLNLYFQKFEFNASLYYVSRWVGFQYIGYNLIKYIGPSLALLVFLGILVMTFTEKNIKIEKLPQTMLFAICLYLMCTTTVHPWYVSLPLVLCLFTPYRFPVLWSALIAMTYINYSYTPYHENLWVVAIEYLAVFTYFLWERKKIKNIQIE